MVIIPKFQIVDELNSRFSTQDGIPFVINKIVNPTTISIGIPKTKIKSII